MEMLKCNVCVKSFSGLICFQQHEASEKHKRKVELMKSIGIEITKPENFSELMPTTSNCLDSVDQLQCAMCKISFSSLDNYQKHVNSLEHAIMVQKKNNDLLSPSLSNTFQSNTRQSQLTVSPASFTSPSKAIAFFSECKLCQKQFSGPEPYQQHLESAGHIKKCKLSAGSIQKDETDSILRKHNTYDNFPHEPLSFESGSNLGKTVPRPFAKCNTCEMEFNGELSYQLHLVSDSHNMKTGNQLLGNSSTASQSAFKCDLCNMTFSGPIPYQQHLISNGHTKKTNAANLSKHLATGPLLPSDTTLKNSNIGHEQSTINNRQWFCECCNKQCSGQIPYNSHISGREHSKNLKIKEIEANLQKVKNFGPLRLAENSIIESDSSNQVTSTVNLDLKYKSELEESSLKCKMNDLNRYVNSDAQVISDKFQMTANDLIALPNFNIIPPEKLDITVFQPVDEIVFSSPKKCI